MLGSAVRRRVFGLSRAPPADNLRHKPFLLNVSSLLNRQASTKSKKSLSYVCSSCGHDSVKWYGICPSCRSEDSFKEFRHGGQVMRAEARSALSWLDEAATGMQSRLTPMSKVKDVSHKRTTLGSEELDRLFGGGLVAGSAVLLAGPPGVGKSTLALQATGLLCNTVGSDGVPYAKRFAADGAHATPDHKHSHGHSHGGLAAYISGEESASQVKGRAKRLGLGEVPGLLVMNSTSVEDIIQQLEGVLMDTTAAKGEADDDGHKGNATASAVPAGGQAKPVLRAVVIDSIQTMSCEGIDGSPGQAAQVREAGVRLSRWARTSGIPVILVGHVTKAGDVAGPRVLEHLVDAVMVVEGEEGLGSGHGEAGLSPSYAHAHRVVRATKNRFGSTSELGLFVMTDEGFKEAKAGAMFLTDHSNGNDSDGGHDGGEAEARRDGCAVATVMEGSRALCVEVQALVTPCMGQFPRHRAINGIVSDRLHLAWAVLCKHAAVSPYKDLLANVAGGLRLTDPSADLALAMAVASSHARRPLPQRTVFIGELGLGGEIRSPARLQERLRAAAKLGFQVAYVGAAGDGSAFHGLDAGKAGIEVRRVRSIKDAVYRALGSDAFAKRNGQKAKKTDIRSIGGHDGPSLTTTWQAEDMGPLDRPTPVYRPAQPGGRPQGLDSSMDDDIDEDDGGAGEAPGGPASHGSEGGPVDLSKLGLQSVAAMLQRRNAVMAAAPAGTPRRTPATIAEASAEDLGHGSGRGPAHRHGHDEELDPRYGGLDSALDEDDVHPRGR